jgi:hypothetical protein
MRFMVYCYLYQDVASVIKRSWKQDHLALVESLKGLKLVEDKPEIVEPVEPKIVEPVGPKIPEIDEEEADINETQGPFEPVPETVFTLCFNL